MASGTSASIRGKNSEPSELRIVLIGGRGEPSGKSSVGNIILGRDVFETNSRTVKSVMRQEVVSGRQVTVVDTPGWTSSHPLDLTPKLTQLEIQQSVNLCPPGGPHAFVLVMPLDIPYEGTVMSAEEHLSLLLSDRVWKHTIVVFTVADKTKMRPDLIISYSVLRYLTDKCEGRFHVLNISDRGDRSQVTELMEKIDQMVTSNGCHYETEKHVSEELKEMERTISRRAEQRRADAQKQTTGLPKDTVMDLIDPILDKATSLYPLCEEVKGKKKQCQRLVQRVKGLEQLVLTIKQKGAGQNSADVEEDLRDLKETLESAEDVVKKYISDSFHEHVFKDYNDNSEFKSLNGRLNSAFNKLSKALQVDHDHILYKLFDKASQQMKQTGRRIMRS